MFRFSNWVFLIFTVGFAYIAIRTHGRIGGEYIGYGLGIGAIEISLIASYCGIVSFVIQSLIWIANIVRWISRRHIKST
jgi:hypothetical protein